LLNADIALLTIGSVDALPSPSLVKCAVYWSALSATASIIISLLLVWHTRNVESSFKHAFEIVRDSMLRKSKLTAHYVLSDAEKLSTSEGTHFWKIRKFINCLQPSILVTDLGVRL
jgi:hypothetical protein